MRPGFPGSGGQWKWDSQVLLAVGGWENEVPRFCWLWGAGKMRFSCSVGHGGYGGWENEVPRFRWLWGAEQMRFPGSVSHGGLGKWGSQVLLAIGCWEMRFPGSVGHRVLGKWGSQVLWLWPWGLGKCGFQVLLAIGGWGSDVSGILTVYIILLVPSGSVVPSTILQNLLPWRERGKERHWSLWRSLTRSSTLRRSRTPSVPSLMTSPVSVVLVWLSKF